MRYAPTLDPAMNDSRAVGQTVPHSPAPAAFAPLPALGRRPLPAWIGALGLALGQGGLALGLLVFLALPLAAILVKSVTDADGGWAGLSVIAGIIGADGFLDMVGRSLAVGIVTTLLVVPCAYGFAYGLTRTRLPGKGILRTIALLPLLAPSLLPGIALVYLLGNQGLLKGLSGGVTIYGFWGIVLGEAFYTFPHALMILLTGLALADGRLYDAARAMGAGTWRTFMTVTLPGTRYAVFSACCVVFTLTVTDFGVPKVVGGDYNVLAMEAYKAVVGQQNFPKGAAIGILLLLPALLTFVLDRRLRARQGAQMSGRAQPYAAGVNGRRDAAFLALSGVMAAFLLLIIGVAVWASFVKMWPYNLSMSLRSYDFDNMDGGGWLAWRNSLQLAFFTALAGTLVVFVGAWMMEKVPARGAMARGLRGMAGMLALMPMAVPGLVLGLGYIFFFNSLANPLNVLYGTMPLLVLCTVVHFYTSAHLTAATALNALDPEFEAASASLKVPRLTTFLRVTLPMCLPAALDVARYLFVSAMTTVSAVVFLYSPSTVLAAVAVLNMDDAGFIGPAAAMCTVIMASSAAAALVLHLASRALVARTQAWRRPATR
ncbi:putative 2-aminoethylphosphonate ABC transporter permease subunit [Achromobacter mucicolens]|uniref:putative 2-aminoethylphosphonate ABC transporter permease subunit n=1 Tax=Achromobacter mucicolens TaxID=1389922 RepID=UPI00244B46FF|nr:putative 2-aminoethylphosphonate ABC transporter permease subunit [Achromobacter mucicolens]MDG9966482.1 putative 2-aminoethylphosphonate ABC transporter permease subunit [Achromobacter mucicolens]